MRGADYEHVRATPEEVDDWRRRNPGRSLPAVYRVRCVLCGRRYWGSGIGIGSHRRACPGPKVHYHFDHLDRAVPGDDCEECR